MSTAGAMSTCTSVPCVGHANPYVAEAMARQQATLNVHSRYLHEGVIVSAERLAALHGPRVESIILSCRGTEANEVALRMARFATGKRGIVCTDATYHGNSELVGSLTRIGHGACLPIPRDIPPDRNEPHRICALRGLPRRTERRDHAPPGCRRGDRGADRLLDLRQ
jgi:glutamate-1-semialdehyde aminotransferase